MHDNVSYFLVDSKTSILHVIWSTYLGSDTPISPSIYITSFLQPFRLQMTIEKTVLPQAIQ